MAESSSIASRLGSQSAIFFLGYVFTFVVGFPLQIYVARTLGSSQLGVFSVLEGGIGLLSGLVAFGLAPTLVKFIPAYLTRGEHENIRKLVRWGALRLLVVGIAVYATGMLGVSWIVAYWPALADHRKAVLLMGVLIPAGVLAYYLQQGLRGFQEIRYMVVGSSFLQLTVKALLAVVLLHLGFQLLGYVAAVVLSSLAAAAWLGVGLLRKVRGLPRSSEAQGPSPRNEWSDYARVMYTASLLGLAGAYLDRFLLGAAAGTHAVGVLAVLKQLQQLPVVFLQMLLSVAAPMLAAASARGSAGEVQHVYHLTIDWTVRLSAPLIVFFFVFASPLLALYGPAFASDGTTALRWLLAAQAVNIAFGPVGQILYVSGLERNALRILVWQSALTAAGFFVLIPTLGLVGAVITLCAGTLAINVAEYFVARDALKLRWSDARYLRWIGPLAACIAAAVLVLLLVPDPGNPLVLASTLIALYIVYHGTSLLQGLHADDRELLATLRRILGGVREVNGA